MQVSRSHVVTVGAGLTALSLVSYGLATWTPPASTIRSLQYAASALAALWLGLQLYNVWFGWNARRLYRGPRFPDEPEERLLPVLGYRLGLTACWTALIVFCLLVWWLLWTLACSSLPTAVPLHGTFGTLLWEHGWWLSFVVFSLTTTWQFELIWQDLNRAEEESLRHRQGQRRREGRREDKVIPFVRKR
jgi:hypothetical protein